MHKNFKFEILWKRKNVYIIFHLIFNSFSTLKYIVWMINIILIFYMPIKET